MSTSRSVSSVVCNTLLLLLVGSIQHSFAFLPASSQTRTKNIGLKNSDSVSSFALQAVSAGSGVSAGENTANAVRSAVEAATAKLDGKVPSIAFVASTVSRDANEVREAFAEELPDGTPIHGITSSGAVLTTGGAQSNAVGCLLLSGDDGSFATAYDASDGAKAAAALKEKMPQPQAIFMGSTPGAEEGTIDALKKQFPGVPVVGGTAADDELNGSWSVFSADASSGTGVSLVGISDSVKFGASMMGPYTPTDKKCKATKTDGRRVFEIDGKPAADWAYDWLGDGVKEQYTDGGLVLPQTACSPIGIPNNEGEYVTAHLAAFGGEEKYVDFFTPVPEGSTLTVMDSADGPATGYASALGSAYDTAKSGGTLDGAEPTAGMLIFCGGMAIAVGDNLNSGLTSDDFSSKVGDMPMMGMTCFGEQACLPKSKTNVQRNLSVGCVLFG